MSNWNMPSGVSTNDIPGNEPERTVEELEAALVEAIAEKDEAIGECERLRAKLQKAMYDLDNAHNLLHDCHEELEQYSDVNDGSYGEPSPNRAMSLCTAIDVYFHGIPL